MPRGDKTGPMGNGSKTGRGLGYCTGNNHPGFENNFIGFGRRNGRRFGKGYRHTNGYGRGNAYRFRHGVTNFTEEIISDAKEETLIQNQINILKDQLDSLEKKLQNLKQ